MDLISFPQGARGNFFAGFLTSTFEFLGTSEIVNARNKKILPQRDLKENESLDDFMFYITHEFTEDMLHVTDFNKKIRIHPVDKQSRLEIMWNTSVKNKKVNMEYIIKSDTFYQRISDMYDYLVFLYEDSDRVDLEFFDEVIDYRNIIDLDFLRDYYEKYNGQEPSYKVMEAVDEYMAAQPFYDGSIDYSDVTSIAYRLFYLYDWKRPDIPNNVTSDNSKEVLRDILQDV